MPKYKSEKDDPLIGYRYGKDQSLEVIGWWNELRDKYGARFYKIKCHVCANTDPELHGKAEYQDVKRQVYKGSIPCGCSVAPKWTSEQTKLQIIRICNEKGYEVKFPDVKIEAKTKVELSCKCGYSWKSCSNTLKRGSGCLVCNTKAARESKRISDTEMKDSLIKSGKFSENHEFVRISYGRQREVEVYCPVCSVDKYVQAGLCSGVFVANYSNLSTGKQPCRCSGNFKYSKEQREFSIRDRISKELLPYEFIGWAEEFKGAFTKFNISCSYHGIWSVCSDKFVSGRRNCPSCAVGGYSSQKTGYVYVLKVEGVVNDFVGYGISNNPAKRIVTHNSAFNSTGYILSNKCIFKMSGDLAPKIEQQIKYKFPKNSQEVSNFKTEATDVEFFEDVINFVKTFEVEDVTTQF